MDEEIKTNESTGGRPEISADQYRDWLEDMRPFLENASTLYYACRKAGIEKHYGIILKKYNEKGPLYEKINALRGELGELANESFARLIRKIADKTKRDEALTEDERKILEHFTKTHRTAQPFFVNKTETSDSNKKDKDLGKIIDPEPAKIQYIVPTKPDEPATIQSTTESSDAAAAGTNTVQSDVQTTPSVSLVDGPATQ